MNTVVLSEIFPPHVGGSGRWLWELYRRLEPEHTQFIVGESEGSQHFDQSTNLNIDRLPLTLLDWGVFSLKGWRNYNTLTNQVKNLIQTKLPHAIHCGRCLPEGFIARKLSKKLGIPYVIYVHGEELNTVKTSRQLTWMTCRVFQDAKLIVANSHNTAKIISQDWPVQKQQITVIHPGCDTAKFRPAPFDSHTRASLGWSDRLVILTVGRLQKRKGQDRMIQAINVLRQKHPKLLYAIVGNGPDYDQLKQLINQYDLHHHVKMYGQLDDQTMIQAFQQCDLFALPNRPVEGDIEGFGMVLVEAQACGKPVLAGDSGGTRETMQINETGVICDCTKPNELENTLDLLLNDPQTMKIMGTAARQWAVQQFDWTTLTEQARTLLLG